MRHLLFAFLLLFSTPVLAQEIRMTPDGTLIGPGNHPVSLPDAIKWAKDNNPRLYAALRLQELGMVFGAMQKNAYGTDDTLSNGESLETLFNKLLSDIAGYVNDKHTTFHPAKSGGRQVGEARQLPPSYKGVGIDISLITKETSAHKGEFRVGRVHNGGARRAGILYGDIIVKVDGNAIKDRPIDEVVGMIIGEADTTVVLTVNRKGVVQDISVTRGIVKPTVLDYKLFDKTLYLRLYEFDGQGADEVAKYLKDHKDEYTSLILDLRFNGGGLLTEAHEFLDMFLSEGLLVTTKKKDGVEDDHLYADVNPIIGRPAYYPGTIVPADMPLYILVNEASASASEIVSGTLKAYGRAIIVGTKTYGKGSVQQVQRLPSGGAIRFTTHRYFVGGDKIPVDGIGVMPDITVDPVDPDLKDDARDEALADIHAIMNQIDPTKDVVLRTVLDMLGEN